MDELEKILQKEFGENRIRKDEGIAKKIASRIGGKVSMYFEVTKQLELIKALQILEDQKAKYLLIGTGSNTVISDEGYDGVIIKNNTRKFEVLSMRGKIKNNKVSLDKAYLYAESGCILNQAIRYSLEQGMGGLEDLLGTPGSVGGFLRRSFSANEKNSAINSLYQVRLIDKKGQLKFIDPTKNPLTDTTKLIDAQDIILTATFLLTPDNEKKLWDKATRKSAEKEINFDLGNPLGILFHDISLATAMRVPTPNYITSAEDLIKKSGAAGLKKGGAMNLTENSNLLINSGNATTKDIIDLVTEIRSRVFKKFGVKLEMQLKIIK